MTSKKTRAVLSLLVLPLLLFAACGDDTGGGGTAEGAGLDDGTGSVDEFPITVEHKYGETVIDAAPERVVSVGYTDQDFVLSLGVVPVGIRDWYGDQPSAVWPWAQDALGDAEPEVLSSTEINFEAVAALRPDLIVGVTSGMTDEEYATLTAIAPTITQTDEFVDYGVPWQDVHRTIGRALGRSDLAEEQIAGIETSFSDIADAHPEWSGREATVSYGMSESTIGAYASDDTRSRLLTDLGFVIPPEIDELADGLFYSEFSLEEIDQVDRDLLVWIGAEGSVGEQIRSHPLHDTLAAVQEGREIFWTELQGAAAGFSSPLSLPYLLDSFVPQLEAAMDADPATEIPAG